MGIFAKLFGKRTPPTEVMPAPTEVCPVVEARIERLDALETEAEEKAVPEN